METKNFEATVGALYLDIGHIVALARTAPGVGKRLDEPAAALYVALGKVVESARVAHGERQAAGPELPKPPSSHFESLCRAWHDAVGDTPIVLAKLLKLLQSVGTDGFVQPELASSHRKALGYAIVDIIEMPISDPRAPKTLSRHIRTEAGKNSGGFVLRKVPTRTRNTAGYQWQMTKVAP